eukprot:TRINITY_DN12108_c0_g1_i2.p1 TRINITY_DN12108_c0_g1~~TRINITY_DN12108_c0_g1_i2.p1  ORF type:complete len:885 (-),score=294.43 TRINITY_DN12108_c0_g1_i2:412-3066(-)
MDFGSNAAAQTEKMLKSIAVRFLETSIGHYARGNPSAARLVIACVLTFNGLIGFVVSAAVGCVLLFGIAPGLLLIGFASFLQELASELTSHELKAAIQATRVRIADAERRREAAIAGSMADRAQLYRLRGELTALQGSEDRIAFLGGVVDHATAASEARGVVEDNVKSCRSSEQQRLAMEEAEAEVDSLEKRVREIEAATEAALQQREAEESSCQSLSAETTEHRAKILRLRVKITETDARILHATKELRLRGVGVDADARRVQAELAEGVHRKKRELKNEEQLAKRSQGEKQFVESVAEKLRTMLEQRSAEIKELQEQLEKEAQERVAIQELIETKTRDAKTLQDEAVAAADAAAGGCGVATPVSVVGQEVQRSKHDVGLAADGALDAAVPKAKGKAGKKAKDKKKKDADDLRGDGQLEDLELELAGVVAAREKAEQQVAFARAKAEERNAHALEFIARCEEESRKVDARLQEARPQDEDLFRSKTRLAEIKAARKAAVDELEKLVKDAEREKIRIRLDIKRVHDGTYKTPESAPSAHASAEAGKACKVETVNGSGAALATAATVAGSETEVPAAQGKTCLAQDEQADAERSVAPHIDGIHTPQNVQEADKHKGAHPETDFLDKKFADSLERKAADEHCETEHVAPKASPQMSEANVQETEKCKEQHAEGQNEDEQHDGEQSENKQHGDVQTEDDEAEGEQNEEEQQDDEPNDEEHGNDSDQDQQREEESNSEVHEEEESEREQQEDEPSEEEHGGDQSEEEQQDDEPSDEEHGDVSDQDQQREDEPNTEVHEEEESEREQQEDEPSEKEHGSDQSEEEQQDDEPNDEEHGDGSDQDQQREEESNSEVHEDEDEPIDDEYDGHHGEDEQQEQNQWDEDQAEDY